MANGESHSGENIPSAPQRVLVADDEHLVASSLADALIGMGMEVIGPASSGTQALEIAKRHKPDLALLDIRMPGIDGLSLGGMLFNQMNIPVVIISAYSDQEYLDQGTQAGIFGYLLKPVDHDGLRVSIGVAWARYVHHIKLRTEVQDLRVTLDNRKVIEKAKGLLMQRLKIGEDQAMKMLQQKARASRRKLVDLASAIIETTDMLGP